MEPDPAEISRAHRSLSVVLSEKQGRRLFLREAYRRFGAFSVRFIELDRDEVLRLDAIFRRRSTRCDCSNP